MRAHGILFHHFHDKTHHRVQGSLSAEDLNKIIGHLGRDRIIDADEWLRRAESSELAPTDICLTFDDNLRSQFDIALPVLREHGIKAFWFVYSSPLEGVPERLEIDRTFRNTAFSSVHEFYEVFNKAAGSPKLEGFDPKTYLSEFPFYDDADREFRFLRDRVLGPRRYAALMDGLIAERRFDVNAAAKRVWMDAECLKTLVLEGHRVGLHSHTHPTRISALPFAAQFDEYEANCSCLTRILGRAPDVMAHPSNSYDERTLQILKDLGVRIGFRADMTGGLTPYEFPREDHANLMRALELR